MSHLTPQTPDPARTERHMRICKQLAELGRELAHAAAAAAHAQFDNPEAVDPEQPEEAYPVLVFTRLASVVRQAITLEARLAGGTATRSPAPDPRRLRIRAAIANATQDTLLRLEMNEHLECELAADPEGLNSLEAILESLADEYDLDPEDLDLMPGL